MTILVSMALFCIRIVSEFMLVIMRDRTVVIAVDKHGIISLHQQSSIIYEWDRKIEKVRIDKRLQKWSGEYAYYSTYQPKRITKQRKVLTKAT